MRVDENAVGRENTENPRGLWRRTLQEDVARGRCKRTLQEDVSRHNQRASKNIPNAREQCERTGLRGSISLLLKDSFSAADCSFSCSCGLLPGLPLFLSIFEKNVLCVCVCRKCGR
jgi:hypothetical protein